MARPKQNQQQNPLSKLNNYYSTDELEQIDIDGIFIRSDLLHTLRRLKLKLIREEDNEGQDNVT